MQSPTNMCMLLASLAIMVAMVTSIELSSDSAGELGELLDKFNAAVKRDARNELEITDELQTMLLDEAKNRGGCGKVMHPLAYAMCTRRDQMRDEGSAMEKRGGCGSIMHPMAYASCMAHSRKRAVVTDYMDRIMQARDHLKKMERMLKDVSA